MKSWMTQWNLTHSANHTSAAKADPADPADPTSRTSRTCRTNELWANCFMRLAGLDIDAKGLGCAQVGPNTCPEPKRDDLLRNDVETAYGIYSIWCT